MGDYGTGASVVSGGAVAVASLPNTGGSRNVVVVLAITSMLLGAVILTSAVVRTVAKRR